MIVYLYLLNSCYPHYEPKIKIKTKVMEDKKYEFSPWGCAIRIYILIGMIVGLCGTISDNLGKPKQQSRQSFIHAEYRGRDVLVDTSTKVMYDKKLGAIIDLDGKPIPYEGKFPS